MVPMIKYLFIYIDTGSPVQGSSQILACFKFDFDYGCLGMGLIGVLQQQQSETTDCLVQQTHKTEYAAWQLP